MKIIQFLCARSWKLLLLALSAGIISGVSGAVLIAMIAHSVVKTQTLQFAGLFAALCLLQVLAKSGSQIAIYHLSQGAIVDLRVSLSRKILATSQRRQQELGKADMSVMLTKDIDILIAAFQLIPAMVTQAVVIISCMAYMATIAWDLLLVLAGVLVTCLLGFHFVRQFPLQLIRNLREKMNVLYKNSQSLIDGSRELQLNARKGQAFIDEVIAQDALQFKSMYIRAHSAYAWIANVGDILFILLIGFILLILPLLLSIEPAALAAVTMLLLFLIGPISILINTIPTMSQAAVAMKKIGRLDTALETATDAVLQTSPFDRHSGIFMELQGVCHQYASGTEDGQFMLGPLDLQIHQGEILFIVGGNGSGKTTLAMLLLGLNSPEQGVILLNGVPVTPARLSHYRAYFTAVFADFHLFEQLLENADNARAARANYYLQLFGMDARVRVENARFSTTALSTGQRKRLALVVAYLEDRPVYLFDEWAADQDPAFKKIFYGELLPELKSRGKTVIVITHDDEYFDSADRVLTLTEGRLASLSATVQPVAGQSAGATDGAFNK